MKKKVFLGLIMATFCLSGCSKSSSDTNLSGSTSGSSSTSDATESTLLQYSDIEIGEEIAIIRTSLGDIKVRFFPEQAPKAVENFLTLAEEGYYDGLTFHRVVKDFVIQGGDPNGDGTGGESIWGDTFENEIDLSLRHFNGALSMANTGNNDNGSQFFIVQNSELEDSLKEQMEYFIENQDELVSSSDGETSDITIADLFSTEVCEKYLEVGGCPHLDGSYTVFGQVFEGMDIVDKIANVQVVGEEPVEDVIIESIIIEEYTG